VRLGPVHDNYLAQQPAGLQLACSPVSARLTRVRILREGYRLKACSHPLRANVSLALLADRRSATRVVKACGIRTAVNGAGSQVTGGTPSLGSQPAQPPELALGQCSSWRFAARKTVTSDQHNLRVGLVDFADPTFLLIGDSRSFYWLAEQIKGERAVTLEGEPGKDRVRFSIVPSDSEGRVSRMGPILEWQMSASEAALVSRQLRELAASSSPAHAYLDPASNLAGVQIMVSRGEYDPARVFVE
jgi:hypothetical protein